jgi:hypothetical protein
MTAWSCDRNRVVQAIPNIGLFTDVASVRIVEGPLTYPTSVTSVPAPSPVLAFPV